MSKAQKKVINKILLWVSIGASTYIFAQMTDIYLVQGLFFALIAIYEIVMQGVLGVGLILIRQGKWRILPGILCILLYVGGYVGIYAVPTAMGVFLLHVDRQAVKAEITQAEYDVQKRILDLDLESMENYNLQMKTESKTGYGRQSEKVTEEQNKLRAGLDTGLARFREVSREKTKVSINVFESLSEVIEPIKKVSPTTIKLVMFMTLFLGMYLGLIFTHEEFEFSTLEREDEDKESDSRKFKTSVIKKNKTSKKLRNKTSQSSSESYEESFVESSGRSSQESLPLRKVSKPQSEWDEWERFVRASIRDTGNLNSARRVHMLTGIPIDRCAEYRKRLDEMEIEGIPVVATTQGGSRANFEKREILEAVRERAREAG